MFEDSDQPPSARLPAGEWEHLAALTGFKPDPPPGKRTATATLPEPSEVISGDRPSNPDESTTEKAPSQEQPASLLDPEDFLESEEDKAATKATLWTSPWAKAGFVASIIGVGIGSIGLFLWSVQNIKPTLNSAKPTQQSQVEEQPSIDPDQEQIGNLKTVNALGTQAQALNKQTQMRHTLTKPSKGLVTKPTQTTQPVSTAIPTRDSAPPTYSSVAYNPPPAPALLSPPPMPVRSFAASSTSPVDPQTAWQEAMSAGSYGEGPGDVEAEPTPVAAPTLVANQTVGEPANSLEDSRYQADAAAILSGTTSHFVSALPGAIASATLQTPIFWAQDLKPEQQPQRFAIRLNTAIPAANGTVALPSGTQMIAQVSSISESGLVQLSVTQAVSPTGQTIPLPVGAIGVTGEQGKPILAELQNTNGGQIAGMDMQTALFGALGQVGQLLNRPTNESTTTSPYLSSTSVSNGNTNILGGILQGAFTPLMQQVQQRNQQAMQQVLDRPSLWVVPANQPLQIFVTSSFGVAQP